MSALAFNNSTVQELRRLIGRRSSRHDAGRFVVEGPVLVAEAVAAGWIIESQFVPEGTDAWIGDIGDTFELAAGVFERVASTQSAAAADRDRAACVSRRRRRHSSRRRFVVVLDGISDPGNLGTIIRSAEAAGVDLVVLTPGSVDPYSPKVVRSSAGAIFHVPVVSRRTRRRRRGRHPARRHEQPRCARAQRSSRTRPATSPAGSPS